MGKYAQGTRVSVTRSIEEIEYMIVSRFEASEFMQAKRNGDYQCWWQIRGTTFTARLPPIAIDASPQEVRRLWRVLVQQIKVQLVAVDEGLIEGRAAMAQFLMLPDGSMAGASMEQQIEASGGMHMPALMEPKENR